jgi:sulfonate transport system substrate-binding protein
MRTLIPSLLLLAAGAAPIAAADNPTVIRIGYPGVAYDGYSPVGVNPAGALASKGLLDDEFKKDGIKIEWTFFPGAGPALNEALANHLLDFAAGLGDLPAIVHRAGGLRTELLAANARRQNTYIIVPDDSRAKELKDLIGKRLALQKGTNGSLAWSKIVKDAGLTEDQFKVINLDPATARGAIAAKDIDGYIGGTDVFPLVARGVGRVVYTTSGRNPSLERFTNLYVTEDFEHKYPAVVQRFVDVFVKEAAWESNEDNRTDVFKVWAKNGEPISDFKTDYGKDTLASHLSPLLDEQFYNHFNQAIKLSVEFKFIRNEFDLGTWVNDKYLKQALKDDNLEGFWQEYDAQGNLKVAQNAKQ